MRVTWSDLSANSLGRTRDSRSRRMLSKWCWWWWCWGEGGGEWEKRRDESQILVSRNFFQNKVCRGDAAFEFLSFCRSLFSIKVGLENMTIFSWNVHFGISSPLLLKWKEGSVWLIWWKVARNGKEMSVILVETHNTFILECSLFFPPHSFFERNCLFSAIRSLSLIWKKESRVIRRGWLSLLFRFCLSMIFE